MFNDLFSAIDEAEFIANSDGIKVAICCAGKVGFYVVKPLQEAMDNNYKILEVIRSAKY